MHPVHPSNLVRTALALRVSNPRAPARAVLDEALQGCGARLADFGPELLPPAAFALEVAEAFDRGMSPQEWRNWSAPPAHAAMVTASQAAWAHQVLPAFAAAYGLAP